MLFKSLLGLGLLIVGVLVLLFIGVAGAVGGDLDDDWSSPRAMSIKRISDLPRGQYETNLINNMDCTQLTFRFTGSSDMQSGCFVHSAYGLLDPDNAVVIFNSTDEALRLLGYTPQQVLIPWPNAGNLIALQASSNGGSYISIYKHPIINLSEQRSVFGQLVSKQLTAPPDLPIKDVAGQNMAINVQSMAFSAGGSWLVAEDMHGSFVRVNLASLQVLPFAPAYAPIGAPGLQRTKAAVSSDGQFVAIANDSAGEFKIYNLATCKTSAGFQYQNCNYSDYLPFISQQVPSVQSIRHVRFVNDHLLSFEVHTSNGTGEGIYELSPRQSIDSLIDYLALGDSYTSGEGAFDYILGTDTDDNGCHLSFRSYPMLLTKDLFGSIGGHSVACSGAVINDVGSTNDNYFGQVRNVPSITQLKQINAAFLGTIFSEYKPGYIAQQRFVGQYQPTVLTVSVGGNDIGFGDIIQRCVEPKLSPHKSDSVCFNTYEDRLEVTDLIDRTVNKFIGLYKQLAAASPGSKIFVVGYPQTVYKDGNCAVNVHLSKSELEFTVMLTDYLNASVSAAAAKAGASYVDISDALNGHRLCEAASYNIAVNGLTAGKDGAVLGIKVFGKESYHPNALGHELIEQAILKQTHNLATGNSGGGSDNQAPRVPSKQILDAPATGRAINSLVVDDNMVDSVVIRGSSTKLQVAGIDDGLKPYNTYVIRLDGTFGDVISNVVADQEGNITNSLQIPAQAEPGGHSLDITGVGIGGSPIDITMPIYVGSSEQDLDGDGIINNKDSCPSVSGSSVDDDSDGQDDKCQAIIGKPIEVFANSGGSNNNVSRGINGETTVLPNNDIKTAILVPENSIATNFKVSSTYTSASKSISSNGSINPVKIWRSNAASSTFTPVKISKTSSVYHRPLRVINWIVYLALLIIAWWFLVITYYFFKKLFAWWNQD